jgi:hypothetical protein
MLGAAWKLSYARYRLGLDDGGADHDEEHILVEASRELRITENQRVARVTAFGNHQRDLCCFQKRFTLLTDAAAQIRIPKREFSLSVTQGTFGNYLFEQRSNR